MGIKWLVPRSLRSTVRSWRRRVLSIPVRGRLSVEEFRLILLRELKIRKGSSVLIHCSYGALKLDFSPIEAIELLKEIVGTEGNILMPCYPGNGDEWLYRDEIFDLNNTPITTGVLAEEFRRSPDVYLSKHPIKSLAAWGKDRDYLVCEHHLSRTPFDFYSPYYKLLSIDGSFAVGLGTKKFSFIHCCEDSVESYSRSLYLPDKFSSFIRTGEGNILNVATLCHDGRVLSKKPSSYSFLKSISCPGYEYFYLHGRFFYRAELVTVFHKVSSYLSRYE